MPLFNARTSTRFNSHTVTAMLLLLSCFLSTGQAMAEVHDVPYYSKSSEFTQVKISPDGKHLAVMIPVDGRNGVAILDTETLKPTWIARFSGEKQIGEFHWANSERLIARLEMFRGWNEHPTSAGEWFAANVDGKRQKNIYGYRAGGLSSKIKRAESVYGYGQIIDLLEDDPDNILMSSTPFSRVARRPTLIKVNVYNGKHKEVALSPIANSTFLTDHSGRARFVAGSNDEGNPEIYYREDEGDDWVLLSKGSEEDGFIRPLAFVDENTVYIADDTDESIAGVFTLDLKTGEKTLVYRNETANPSNFWFTPNGRKLYALEIEPLLPTYVYLDTQSSEVQLLRQLLKAFPGQQVRLASQTLDGNLAIIRVFSDRNPGTFYLFDKTKKQARHLVHSRPWVDPNESASVKPVEFTARDGMTIRGYLTLPAGKEAKNLPLVVNPHGGPHGPRDWWGYNPEAQFLASRGIAVLQVNFRGSGGYGRDFEQAGYRKWGSEIQYDIIDGTRHLIDQGIVDEKRICIYGGSFGGYSALQSPILEPDLFACAVGFVGVYDLEMLYTKGDIPTQEAGVAILEKYVGRDEEELRAFSPIYHVDKLKTALLIVHGEEDPRAPIEHAYALRDALDEIDYPYEWMVMDKEGHGFYNEKNREKMFRKLFAFIEKHIQLDAPPGP
ncbi:MAG: S9 family peptidase [Chromatiales bacterium]|nr:S9 family peptidase [Chromatiales bacterium]